MPLTLSGNGTISGLVAGGLPDGAITGSDIAANTIGTSNIADSSVTSAKLAESAAANNIGYFPQPWVRGRFTATSTGGRWCRVARMPAHRQGYHVTVNVDGGSYSPGQTSFTVFANWSNEIFVGGVVKLGSQYATSVRLQAASQGNGEWFLEVFHPNILSTQLLEIYRIGIASLSYPVACVVDSFGTDAANLAFTSSTVTL